MFKGFYNLTSAMLTHGRNLDVIANNMTNVATAGFKGDKFTASTFRDVMWYRVGNKDKRYTELGTESFITAPSQLYTDYTQGSFDETELALDFGIEGEGFFAIETAEGNRAYTRNGSFSLDEEGYLVLSSQGRVLDTNGEPILLMTDKIKADEYGGIFTLGGGFLGRIGVYAFPDNGALEKNERGLFVSQGQPEPTLSVIHHGMVERSNVDWVEQMKDMIAAQRAYQSAAEVSKIYDELTTKAVNDVGRM